MENPLAALSKMSIRQVDTFISNQSFIDVAQFSTQALNFFMIVSSALMIWKGLSVVTNSESPIVVVLR